MRILDGSLRIGREWSSESEYRMAGAGELRIGLKTSARVVRSEILKARERKHVVASLGNMATSGGYYVALGAEKIVTNPGTLTGSIGVVLQHPVLEGLMRTVHVDMQTYKSGGLKDSGSPFRAPSEADRIYLQDVTEQIHEQFVDAVTQSRKLPREKVAPWADGRVITGAHAVELGLADALGTLTDAAALAVELAEVPGEPELVYPERPGGLLADLLHRSVESAARAWHTELSMDGPLGFWPALPSLRSAVPQVQ
jgi:protease-4